MKRVIKKLDLFLPFILILLSSLLVSCGEPKIDTHHVNFMEVPDKPMIPADYLIGQGDELEVLYYIDPGSSISEYQIDTEDTLRIEFYYYPGLNKTVRVRPDGFITLARVGDVKALDRTPKSLAAHITDLYKTTLKKPVVTVEVIEFNVKVENLKAAVRTTTRGQSRQVLVRPDGKISLPYINDIKAKNKTCAELSQTVEKKYRKFVKNISITVAMLKAHSNRVYIMGEIEQASFYQLSGPRTLTQLIAEAGGFSSQANTHQIVLIRRGKDGKPTARLIDMDNIIGRGDMTSDPFIRQYDIIFVPKTKLSQAALVMDSIMNLIPVHFSASYSLGGEQIE
ncbi:MAG: polysaccharide biosynthesis/export family protein [Candidatus Electrothrix scaldis]|nr:MAG: polysaccharide biosynthesis/export family protein [Candidatus Electrothrix sp. GW3-3]